MKVLVLVADALHLGYLACYGNEWIDTPALDDLAASGIVFDQHISDWPDAAGARRAWRSGSYHFIPSTPAPVDLVALLRQHGVFTSLVIDGSRPQVAAFAEGWDSVQIVAPEGDGTPMELTLDAVQAALDRWAAEAHALLWVELATLRPPWHLPDDFRGRYFDEETEDEEGPLLDPPSGLIESADDALFLRLQRSYAGAVAYLDAGLGLLAEELEQRGLLTQTLILLTSDHGLPLGEHGALGLARPWLHDELVHVPLILRLPDAAESGRRVSALTQPVDLAPTLLDAFGVPLPPLHGRSLLPLAHGTVEKVRDYACTGVEVDGAGEWALRTPELAVLLPLEGERPPQLYIKPDDRWEVNDLRQQHLEEAEQLERILREFVGATQQPGPLQAPPLPEEETPDGKGVAG